MILIGMFDSPFVRRVAVSMNLLGMPFEHRNWSVGKDFELIRQFNPLGRVPTLVQPDGDTLVESAAILDFLDEMAGPEHALLPRSGEPRVQLVRLRFGLVAGCGVEPGSRRSGETRPDVLVSFEHARSHRQGRYYLAAAVTVRLKCMPIAR